MNGRARTFPQDDDFVPLAEFDSRAEAEEYALVILAMGLPCLIREFPSGDKPRYEIVAGQARAEAIRREFAAYASEQSDRPGEKLVLPVFPTGMGMALLWAVSVLGVFRLQIRHPWVTDRFCSSSLDLFDRGEWWRPFTAMFLHADFAHLLGNLVFGLIFFVLVGYSIGPRFGWLLILVSGALANTATAWLRYPAPHASLGASTATFAALGILVGFGAWVAWRTRSYRKLSGIVVPFGAGIFLLGWLGSGDPPTDVLGHLFAFVAGSGSGLIAAAFRLRPAPPIAGNYRDAI